MSVSSSQPPKLSKATLAHGYSPVKRVIDIVSIIGFFVSEIFLMKEVVPHIIKQPFIVLPALLAGFIAADFTSGFVHWLGDTWGSAETPILGRAFIRPFREHHIDQTAITRHDFIETNGSNCLASLFILVPAIIILLRQPTTLFVLFLMTGALSLSLGVFGTNQFHKWAHLARPSKIVRTLQNWHLILSPIHHAIHHNIPHDRYYCITVGWLNKLLEKIHFFPAIEKVVTYLTGVKARKNDQEMIAS